MRKNVLVFMQRLRWFTALKIDEMRAQHMVMLIAKSFLSYFVFFINTDMWRKWHGDNPCLPTSTWLTTKVDRITLFSCSGISQRITDVGIPYTRPGESVIMELLEAADDSDRRGLVNRWLIDNHLPVILDHEN